MSDAAAIGCGKEISCDTTLDADLLCVAAPAFAIVADGVTLDLGGHTVAGDPNRTEGPGIVLRGVTGCTVRNGTVRHFEAGVAIEGGAANVIEDLTVEDNVGTPGADFGDGIVVNDSGGNTVRRNVVRRNGPFSGISLGPRATRSSATRWPTTTWRTSRFPRPDVRPWVSASRGRRPVTTGSWATPSPAAAATASWCWPPVTIPTTSRRVPAPHRTSATRSPATPRSGNGTSGRGCGIRLFSMPLPMPPLHNVVRDNVADDNTSYGIALDGLPLRAPGNQAIRNRAHGNGEFDGSDGTLMPPCGRNVWDANDFGTVNQPGVSKRVEADSEKL